MSDSNSRIEEQFRLALRGMGSSVTIISTEFAGVRYGMVATAAMSVSMAPPSMVVAVNGSASIHDRLFERKAFTINILSEWDQAVARGFTRVSGENRFAHGPWSAWSLPADGGAPLPYLANAMASLFCTISDVFASGSHSLFVGNVIRVLRSDDRAPLLYCDGNYGSFTPSVAATGMPRWRA
jgi:flavin reductase